MKKHCNKCDTTRLLSEFGKDIRKKDGLSYICKSCKKSNEDILTRRRRDSDSKRRLRNRCKAREAAKAYYQDFKLYSCAVGNCQKLAEEFHHVTYEDPLAVIPLCQNHHRMNHELCKIDGWA